MGRTNLGVTNVIMDRRCGGFVFLNKGFHCKAYLLLSRGGVLYVGTWENGVEP